MPEYSHTAATPVPPRPDSGATRILFVDDEPKVLDGLRRMLYPFRGEWQMAFAESGKQALELMAESKFEILVTDLRMPGMSGNDLLERVMTQHPEVIRLVLSGTPDQEFTIRSAGLAHQYLTKPCNADTIRARVKGASNLRSLLDDPGLKALLSKIPALPSMPTVYVKLLNALRSPEASAHTIGAIIEQDLAFTAKILQIANSPLTGLSRTINTPRDAVVYLGIETVRAVTLSLSLPAQFHLPHIPGFELEDLQKHSLKVASVARYITMSLGWPAGAMDAAFVGGLLHDTGKLIMACNWPERYAETMARAARESLPVHQAERAVFGTSHAEVGAYLLWLWGLPDQIVEVVRGHHRIQPELCQLPSSILAVHLADALANHRTDPDVDQEHLGSDLLENLPAWQTWSDQLS